jgi:dihydropteroate synthase
VSRTQPASSKAARAAESASHPLARLLALGRPIVMGVLNVTPDSFSDGGHFFDPERAIDHARALVAEGADVLDVGVESTRPYGGVVTVSADEELRRLGPILPAVLELGIPVSIDTMKAKVAAWALDAGAVIANDVWGLQRDPDMARVVAEIGVPVIVMHNREAADATIDIMADIAAFFARSLAIADRAGIPRSKIVLDPGIGFGKTIDHNLELLRRLDELVALGRPILIGTSRKSFLGKITGRTGTDERLPGTIATNVLALSRGASIFRVHDVREVRDALVVAAATLRGRWTPPATTTISTASSSPKR